MDGMTDEMVEWLPAQLDEDELVARDAGGRDWMREDYGCIVDAADNRLIAYGEGTPSREQADHIVRYDPARMLREIEVKRRRLARHQPMDNGCCDYCHEWGGDLVVWPCVEIRDDASVYADSPGYREEWRP